MTKSDLRKLRRKLPRDYRQQISSSTGLSEIYVYKVLIGERNNGTILDAAIELAKEYQIELEEKKQSIKSL